MIGILTEKPSAARNFAQALGAHKSGSGFTGSFQGEDFIIAHSVGHLYGLVDPRYQVPDALSDSYGSWDIDNLPWDESVFSWRKGAFPKTKDVVTSIRNVLSDCSEVVIATDNDPRACLKNAFCKMCITICGRFRLNEGGVAGYGNRMKAKYTVN